jgi:hypothetical protein
MVKKLLVLALVLAFAQASGPMKADSPSGFISIELNSLTAIANMGVSWIDGVLIFQGKTHIFKMKGLKPSIVGVRSLSIEGEVYNLEAAPNLAGKYQKADPAVSTSIGGEKDLVIRNDQGVVINIRVIKKRLEGKVRTVKDLFKREVVPLEVAPEGLTIDRVQ